MFNKPRFRFAEKGRTAGFDTEAPDIEFEVTCTVPIEVELLNEIEKQAHNRGVKGEPLVNLWLQQKLAELGLVQARLGQDRTP